MDGKVSSTVYSIGEMKTAVKVSIQDHVKPVVQSVPRRVAAARREPVRKELARIEQLD